MGTETKAAAFGFDTKRLRAGYDPKAHNFAVSPPIYQTTSYDFGDVDRMRRLLSFEELGGIYTRIGNPTVEVLEQRVASLDGATGAIALGSGMAAIAYSLFNVAEGGGRILASPYLYGGSFDSFKKVFPRFGVSIDYARDIADPVKLAEDIGPDTKAIFVESISNPNTVLLDLDAIAKVAHDHGIPLIVDNTVATPYLYNAFDHGADVVIYSATKGLSGHGNIIAGLVLENGKFNWKSDKFPHFSEPQYTLRDSDGNLRSILDVVPEFPFTTRIRLTYLNYFGAAIGPLDAYLAILGIETLSERLSRQSATALTLAKYLESHKAVEWVRYPALESSPHHALYKRDFKKGAGGILSFGFKGTKEQRDAFLNSFKLFSYHVNIGDARSLIVNSPENTHGELDENELKFVDIPENLIRISAGLEDVADLIADLEQAFATALS